MKPGQNRFGLAMAFLLAVMTLSATQTRGVSMFSASVEIEIDPASVSISSGTVMILSNDAGSSFGPTTTGTGVISTNTTLNDIGWGTMISAAAGSASFSPVSSATIRNETHDFVYVDNFGNSTPALLTFTMTYDASSSVSTTAAGDVAFSDYNIHITGIGDEAGESAEFSIDGGTTWLSVLRLADALTFPAAPGDEFQLDVAQLVTGPGSAGSTSSSGTVLVRYTVTPDNDNAFSIFTRAGNFAAAGVFVPEPATAGLVLLGVTGLMRRRRMPA